MFPFLDLINRIAKDSLDKYVTILKLQLIILGEMPNDTRTFYNYEFRTRIISDIQDNNIPLYIMQVIYLTNYSTLFLYHYYSVFL